MRWQYDSSVGYLSNIECFREMDQILQIKGGRAGNLSDLLTKDQS